MSFFVVSMVLAAWQFRSKLRSVSSVVLIGLVAVLLGSAIVVFYEGFMALGDKIYQLVIQGDESTGGGRSSATFFEYIKVYPIGIGYGGSTLRTAPGLSEINAAHFAFVTQYSWFSTTTSIGIYLCRLENSGREDAARGYPGSPTCNVRRCDGFSSDFCG
jgi:hypothetical protein